MTSSLVGFALAVLLVSWALREFVQVIRQEWLWLAGAGVFVVAVVVSLMVWRHRRDSW